MLSHIARGLLLGAVLAGVGAAQQPAPPAKPTQAKAVTHALIGTVKSLDAAASTFVVTTPEAMDKTFKFDARTPMFGLHAGARVTALAEKLNHSVVIHYIAEGAALTATSVEYIGPSAPKLAQGTVVRVTEKPREIVIKTTSGVEETCLLGFRAPIETETGILPLAVFMEKKGQQVSLYYAMRGKEKVVHLIKQVGPAVS